MADNQRRNSLGEKTGCPRKYEIREVVNAVFYTSRGGVDGECFPMTFPLEKRAWQ